MRRGKPGQKPQGPNPKHAPQSPWERAESLLERLRTGGPNLPRAAEELDRLQGRMDREGRLGPLRVQVSELCDDWAAAPLRGDRLSAWLALVGAFGLREHTAHAGEVVADSSLPAPVRVQACRVLGALGGEEAGATLQAVLLSPVDPQVRTAAAEALGELGDRAARPVLETLLEEDLPRSVWNAVNTALERLR